LIHEGIEHASCPKQHVWVWLVAVLWLSGAVTGLWVVWAYENRPGAAANPPKQWPPATALVSAADRATLVLIVHPQCDCTRATLGELAEVLARAQRHPKTYVLFLRPAGFSNGWEQTDLWRTAASLPDVTVLRDDDGAEARRFGAETSGQTLLYDNRGALVFSGGITGSRGHEGDNAGQAALSELLSDGHSDRKGTSVFGCALFASGS
jgi:hypothetical protein